MTPFGRWVRDKAEKLLERFYEGPEPPPRLREYAILFANGHRHATRAEWLEFAAELADEAYRSGYTRGYERQARDEEVRITPETSDRVNEIADAVDPNWSWHPSVELENGDIVVLEEPPLGLAVLIEERKRRANGG